MPAITTKLVDLAASFAKLKKGITPTYKAINPVTFDTQLLIKYNHGITPSQVEECHGLHEMGRQEYYELLSVEIVLDGIPIEILPQMSEAAQRVIINLISKD